ncbi:MAG: SDR family NAD(P)-dependent oxidoreductase [Acidobacteriota bacterium]|nr:SDR family NAD(P)-dependent oxidoreductase [Acidobacteriota bacterium]
MATNLHGKKALVTGAARRIGRQISLALADRGVDVALSFHRSEQEIRKTEEDLRAKKVEAASYKADLTDLDDCDLLIDRVCSRFGNVDILVNNASDFPQTKLNELNTDRARFALQFDTLSRLHMRAPLYLGMRLGLQMKQQGWGRIVNITDRVIVKGQAYPHWILYLGTKYGLYGLTQALAVELSPEVTVNSIAPGLAIPPLGMEPQEVQRLRENIPLRKEAGAEEIAEDVIYLIQSSAKTGSVVVTDGGSSVQG